MDPGPSLRTHGLRGRTRARRAYQVAHPPSYSYLGFFGGAENVYNVLAPRLSEHEGVIDAKLDELTDLVRSKISQDKKE